jgi:hypothetical protein
MIRRFGAALIGLALCLPIFSVPVVAHGDRPFGFNAEVLADGTIVGTVTNHTTQRRLGVTVTGKWWDFEGNPMYQSVVIPITNLAPHATSPFLLDPDFDASGMTATFFASAPTTAPKPAGALYVQGGTFTGDSYSGTVRNDGTGAATDVVVYAARALEQPWGLQPTDAAASATIASIAPGASAPYTIDFDAASTGDRVLGLIAQTTAGPYFTSWNNYFGDLGATNLNFVDDIAYLAGNGITTGCSATNFCPKSAVTREQLALFLDRAIGWPDAPLTTQFTDIDSLSADTKQAISNLVANGVTSGCEADKYCPSSTVTRGQMSKFIVLAYGFTVVQTDAFTDDNGHFSEDYNDTMFAEGITSGCEPPFNIYCPNAAVLREQMAVFIQKAETQ